MGTSDTSHKTALERSLKNETSEPKTTAQRTFISKVCLQRIKNQSGQRSAKSHARRHKALMPCHYPVRAFRIADRQGTSTGVVFTPLRGMNVISEFQIPCGQCVGCKVEKSRQWAIRCMHEASLYEENCFITLTYDDDHLNDLSLDYREFQLFMKRLRKKFKDRKIRFYMCGEYGEEKRRPHFHVCLFNLDFQDKVYFKQSGKGTKLYISKTLQELWPYGYTTVAPMTFETAQYAASYTAKKLGGSKSSADYEYIDRETGEVQKLEKEFSHMSLRPGIGRGWYEKYKKEVFPNDRVIARGKAMKPPKYYTNIYKKESPENHDELCYNREMEALKHADDNTEERLLVKERVLKAAIEFKKRRSIT